MRKFTLGVLTFIGLGIGTIFAQSLPDDVEISIKDPLIVGEAANLKITMMKNGSKMTTYDGTIIMDITDENGIRIKDGERVLPSLGVYSFTKSDLGEKEFQKGLEIKKEGTFYIEISDLNENEDQILGKQIIHVISNRPSDEIKNIEVFSPNLNENILSNKIDILASATEIPNSKATIYIDGKTVSSTNVGSDGIINHSIGNIDNGSHTLTIEISDLDGNIIGKSENVTFNISSSGTEGIKNVTVNPENGLMVGDMTTITVYTDETVESIKLYLSDRSENEGIIMNKIGVGQFSQNVFLVGSGEIFLSFHTSSFNNTSNNSYTNYKSIIVAESPSINNIKVNTNAEEKTANISRDTPNNSISSYLIDWRIEGSNTLSGKERSENNYFKFKDVPYDTIVNLTITPYRDKQKQHGVASKTIQFVISKDQTNKCGNGICDIDSGESYELCPQDCDGTGGVTIVLGPSCPPQTISTHTEKIGNNYYLIRDKAENVKKYIIYSSSSPDGKDKVKVYETTDTSYEYPFDRTSKEDIFMYFWVIGICEDGEEVELTGATKVQVGPTENFFLLLSLTFLIYFGIKLFRHTEE